MVSIITPSYNSSAFISQTIESVLAQTFMDWEMLIVDDCSTDISPAIIMSVVGGPFFIFLLKRSDKTYGN